jgi:uncharacterized protein (DUF2141 family)
MLKNINTGYFGKVFSTPEWENHPNRFAASIPDEDPVQGGSGGSGTATIVANGVHSKEGQLIFRVLLRSTHPDTTYGYITFYEDPYFTDPVGSVQLIKDETVDCIPTATLLPNTRYYYYATDNGGSPAVTGEVVSANAYQTFSAYVTAHSNPTTVGGTNGSVTVGASGGTPNYSFRKLPNGGWSSKATSFTFSGLGAGSHSFEVRDSFISGTYETPRLVTVSRTLNDPKVLTVRLDPACTVNKSKVISISGTTSGGEATFDAFLYSDAARTVEVGKRLGIPMGTRVEINPNNGVSFPYKTNLYFRATTNDPASTPVTGIIYTDASCWPQIVLLQRGGGVSYNSSRGEYEQTVETHEFDTETETIKYYSEVWDSGDGSEFIIGDYTNYDETVPFYQKCVPNTTTEKRYFHNGGGGFTTTTQNSTDCGYIPPPDNMTLTVVATGSTSLNSNGTISATVTNGTNTPIKIKIDNGAWVNGTSRVFSNLVGKQNYTIYAEDSAGYTRSKVVKLLDISKTAHQNVTTYGGSNGSLTFVFNLGDGNGLLQTNKNGDAWVNNSSSPSFTGLAAGTYTFGFKDSAGTTVYFTETITQPPINDLDARTTLSHPTTIGGSDGSITINVITASNKPLIYGYRRSGTAEYTNFPATNDTTKVINGLTAGKWHVRITDSAGYVGDIRDNDLFDPSCTLSLTATATPPSTINGNDGSITATASNANGSVQYKLGNGSYVSNNVFTGLASGTYQVWAKDSAGCETSASATVSDPSCTLSLTATATQPTTIGGNDGSITATASNANGSVQYKLSNGSYVSNNVFTGLASGTYQVWAKDSAGCETSTSATVSDPSCTLSITATPTHPTRINGNDGSITLNPSGGQGGIRYTIVQGGVQIGGTNYTSSFTGLAAGSYTIWASDEVNCSTSTNVTLNDPACTFSITATVTHPTVNGGSDGAIAINPSGGQGDKRYSLAQGSVEVRSTTSTPQFTGLRAGSYTVWASDSVDCLKSVNVTIVDPAINDLNISDSTTGATSYGLSDGKIKINATGTNTPFTYSLFKNGAWENNSTGYFTNLAAGNYSYRVTDSANYNRTDTAVVTQPAQVIVATSGYSYNCEGSTKILREEVTLSSITDTYDVLVAKAYNEAKALVMVKIQNGACEIIAKGNSNLVFGEETILLGNVSVKREEEIEKIKHVVVLSSMTFHESTNPTWSKGKAVQITEVGVYDINDNLVAIGKLNKPISKNDIGVTILQLDMEF